MKRILYYSLFLLFIAGSSLIANAQSPTAPALDFNVFLLNSARLVNNETEGPVALGGDLVIDGGYQVSTNYPGSFYVAGIRVTLVVGGKVIYNSGSLQVNQSGYVKIGNCASSTVWYTDTHGAYPPIRITPGSDYNGTPRINLQVASNVLGVSASVRPVCQSGVIDFATAFTTMRAYADTISHLADNAYLTNSGGTVIPHTSLPSQVKLTLHTGLNVLNVNGSDLNAVTDFIYNNTPDASKYLVVNVNAPGSFTWSVYNSGGIGFPACPYILYNFYNTTNLTIAGYGAIEGTVFAPYAEINKTVNMSNIEGQVIAKSYYHAGGENHYAVFAPSIPGCGGPAAPAASYSVNSSNQCLSCNSFIFTNTSTGTAPITYLWTFGDGTTSTLAAPTKAYTATGTYNVKLKVTGPGGVDSVTHPVIVSGNPAYGFTVNDSVQELTGNSFVFTSTAPTFGNVYLWTFDDGTSAAIPNPVKSYTAAGIYHVHQRVTGPGGCEVDTSLTIVVECDGVGGGGGGGLESESLGDLLSKREYNKIKNSIESKVDNRALPVFTKRSAFAVAKNTDAPASTLQRFMPATLDAATVPKITTPADITKITAAVDVFSVDYTKNDISKAVVLAIATKGKPYNHTKSICDRFRGATLLNTETVMINGFKFIQFALRQDNGQVEHSITFAVSKVDGGGNFKLQSKWLISEYAGYTADDSVFNFQVWATTPESVQKLAKDILNSLSGIMPIQQTDVNFTLPPAYIAKGTRNKEFINVDITTATSSNNAKVIFIEKLNEVATEDSLIIPFNLVAGKDNHFSIPIYDGYEYEGHLYLNDTLADDVYMADGNWSLDFDKANTDITNYKPNNNFNRVYSDEEFPIYRSLQVNATTHDYITMYKFIRAGQEKTDLTKYHSYKFYAKGEGKMEVMLIKASVDKFANQYKTTVTLSPTGKNYQISFDDFISASGTPFEANDVKAVVYNLSTGGVPTDFNFFADEQAFSQTVVPSIVLLSSKKVTIYPNPASGKFQVKLASEQDRDLDITLTDITGKVFFKQSVHATMGYNTFDVQLPALSQSLMFVQIGNESVKYGVTKLSVLR